MQKNSLIDTFKYSSMNQLVWKWVIWPFKFLPNLPITVNKSYYIRYLMTIKLIVFDNNRLGVCLTSAESFKFVSS